MNAAAEKQLETLNVIAIVADRGLPTFAAF